MSTTTPEQLAARVETAIEARFDAYDFDEGERWSNLAGLAEQWRECCERWGPKSAAALGCLLALVRESNNDEYAQAIYSVGGWRMCGKLDYAGLYGYPAETEVLLAALEAGQ